jgi:hypothetical protein
MTIRISARQALYVDGELAARTKATRKTIESGCTWGGGPREPPAEPGRGATSADNGRLCRLCPYCLSKTATLFTACPWAFVPFVVTVMVFPS